MELPFAGRCRITELFGAPPPPGYHYKAGYHTGLDLVGVDSRQVLACESGLVVVSHYDSGGWGNYVAIVGEESGLTAIYAHLEKREMQVGQKVKAGQLAGIEGATGNVTGRHLHLEFRKVRTDYHTAVDPCIVLGIPRKLGLVVKEEVPEEDEMIVYKTLKDIPAWGQAVVRKLLDKGYLVGDENGNLNLSQDLVRMLLINDRAGLYD